MSLPVPLDAFSIVRRVDEGAMGTVYRGTHRDTGVPVAVKVLRRLRGDDAERRFHREVRAQAQLLHPGVVYLFEYGQIPDEAAAASEEELTAEAPFVAMEFAERGTVWDAMPPTDWESVCRLLVQVLDPLAHAHARQVVHRDLKPENLLLFDTDDERDRRVALADFGIAYAIDRERDLDADELESTAGTPHYMAPEQFRGRWRDYGPWTDLYALGCIAWHLVCGAPPFDGSSTIEIATSHLDEPRPPLEPQFPVPDPLESWIHRAMAVDPAERFRRAADALWALPRGVLGEPTPDPSSEFEPDAPEDAETIPPPSAHTPTVTLRNQNLPDASTRPLGTATLDTDPPSDAHEPDDSGPLDDEHDDPEHRPLPPEIPPVPEEWRPLRTERLPAPLVGAGLGLFGLREPPFVNREAACDLIWEKLHDVVESGAPAFVYVDAGPGTGKSRLAEWMATRAHEVGAARVIRTYHSRTGGPSEGIQGAAERTFRTLKLDRAGVYEHLRKSLPALEDESADMRERDARALTEYLRPSEGPPDSVDGPAYRFESAEQKRGLAVRLFRRLARDRPVVWWVDDLQWGVEALAMLRHLQSAVTDPPPVLAVATVRSDIVAERPRLQRQIERLERADVASNISLDPLGLDHQRELLEGLLPLEDDLVDIVAERTEGHPLFAMQLLGHWIDRGDIELGPDGFRVSDPDDVDLPASIHDLWAERLDRLLESVPEPRRHGTAPAVELAAALGRDVQAREWQALRRRDAVDCPPDLPERLIERGLARRTDEGWSFAHGLLVETIRRRAREAGRWKEHNRTCARLLEALDTQARTRTGRRLADHWVAAGKPERALDPLFEEFRRWKRLGDVDRCFALLERREQLLDELGAPPTDPRRIRNDVCQLQTALNAGDEPREIESSIREILDRVGADADDVQLARIRRTLAVSHQQQGCLASSAEHARAAAEVARRADDARGQLFALRTLGWVEYRRGNLDEAESCFRKARAKADASDKHYRSIIARRSLASVAMARGEDQRARELFASLVDEARDAGFRYLESVCLNGLGELARFAGDTDEARRRYRAYLDVWRELHRPKSVAVGFLNLALTELAAGDWASAEAWLTETTERMRELGIDQMYDRTLHLARATLAAGTADWDAFDRTLDASPPPDEDRVIPDDPWLLEMAGDRAADHGEHDRARRAWQTALQDFRRLDDTDGERRLTAKLDEHD